MVSNNSNDKHNNRNKIQVVIEKKMSDFKSW